MANGTTLRDLLLGLRNQHEAELRLEQEKADRRAGWMAAYGDVVHAFRATLAPLVAEGLLLVSEEKRPARHPVWGEYEASVLIFEAPGKRAELRPIGEAHPGYAGQALLVRPQDGRRAREVRLHLFAPGSGPEGWQVRLADLQGIFVTDQVGRSDTVFAPLDAGLIEAALEKVLAN